jgi:hypothetical protein
VDLDLRARLLFAMKLETLGLKKKRKNKIMGDIV